MNPIQRVNIRQAKKKLAQFVQKVLAGSLLLGVIGVCAYSQRVLPETIVEVTSEEVEPQPATTFDEIFGSVAQATADATPAAPVQTATIKLNARSFSESVEGGIHLLSYAPATEPVDKKSQRAAPKPEPKKPTAVAQLPAAPRVKLSSDNWPQMKGYQRWQFVAAFTNKQHWVCPPSGHTREWEMEQLSQHDWSTVYNFGFNNCTKPG